jgi:tRNA (cytidine/uridine-2'-O-)-methyltransferase
VHYEPQFHVVLHQPEIAYNTGSVGRTCVAVGAKLWLVRPLGFQISDYHLRRAGMDYWQRLEWEAVDAWDMLLARLGGHRVWYFTKSAERSYLDVEYAQGDVLAFGCESQGLPRSILDGDAPACLRIPIRPAVRSLNLSNSVAIAAYEVVRQFAARRRGAIDSAQTKGDDRQRPLQP